MEFRERFQADLAAACFGFVKSELTLHNYANQKYIACTLCPQEGTLRDRHGTLGTGCDGALWRQAGSFTPGETFAAYGEVVWSWRRDPGVKLRGSSPARATVAKEAAHRGEHEISRKAIARGKPGCFWLNL